MSTRQKLTAVLTVLMACSAAWASKAIGNWDCVHYQDLKEPFKLGIVAFHETGVDVEMFANGVSLGNITDPTYNDRTDCYEYWVEINPADYVDGDLKMTAVITPDGSGHEARTLDTLYLYANSGGTLTDTSAVWVDCTSGNDNGAGTEADPYETLEKGMTSSTEGGTVYLKAGTDYKFTSLYSTAWRTYWTKVTPAPGLTRADVKIVGYNKDGTSNGRFGDSGFLFKDLTFFTDDDSGSYHTILYGNSGQKMWFDGCEFYDTGGQWANGGVLNNHGAYAAFTNNYIHDFANGVGGLRGNYIENICSDIYRPGNNLLSINMTCKGIDVGPTAAHPDFWQCYCTDGVKENCILYNCRAYDMGAQGIFGCNSGCGLKDVAFVNILLEKDPPNSSLQSQPGGMEHVLIYHFTTVDQGWNMRSPTTNVDWTVKNCNWASFHAGDVTELPGQDISHCHTKGLSWNQPTPFGTDATTGDPYFVDYDNDDYRVTDSSACYQSGTPIPGVPADIDNIRYNTTTPNRGCFAAGNTNGIFASDITWLGKGRIPGIKNPVSRDDLVRFMNTDAWQLIDQQGNTVVPGRDMAAGMYILNNGKIAGKVIVY